MAPLAERLKGKEQRKTSGGGTLFQKCQNLPDVLSSSRLETCTITPQGQGVSVAARTAKLKLKLQRSGPHRGVHTHTACSTVAGWLAWLARDAAAGPP